MGSVELAARVFLCSTFGMNRGCFIHAFWLVIALAAFAIGRFTVGTSSEDAPTVVDLSLQSTGPAGPGGLLQRQAADAESAVSAETLPIGAITALTEADIETIAKDAFSDPNPLKRELAFAKLLDGLTAENAAKIREQMRAGGANGDQWRLFQYAWGAVDGPGAIAAAGEIEREDRRRGAISNALSGWASADPQQAIDWLGQLEEEDQRRYQDELVSGLADGDLNLATTYVGELVDAGDRRAPDLMGIVAGEQIRKGGPVAAASWAERLPDSNAKGAALDRVANAYVDEDPATAARWAAQFANEDYGARVIEEVGDEWAERDPASAVSWLESLDESQGKQEGFASALGEWARRDPTAASQYLVDMPASELKDVAVNGFASRLAWEDPQSAIAWAESIQSNEMRVEALTRVGQAYFRRDRNAAIEWLGASGLPEAAQQRILESRGRRRG